jgi:predicted nuclease of predicted toxin-antitoxin system
MPVRVKLDEDLPAQMIERFTAHGMEATSVLSQGWQGMPDDELWSRVQAERCRLVTADRGFADPRRLVPDTPMASWYREWSRRAVAATSSSPNESWGPWTSRRFHLRS